MMTRFSKGETVPVLSCLAFRVGEPDGREPLSRSMPEVPSGSRAATAGFSNANACLASSPTNHRRGY
jgi:hypothetical protein